VETQLTAARLRRMLRYNPHTGLFKWRRALGSVKVGTIAGRIDSQGHKQISIDNRRYMASHLAFLYMRGELPPKGMFVDHRDTDPANDAWGNLRLATPWQNQCNRRRQRNNTTGFKGVSRRFVGKYVASISVLGKQMYLGTFKDPLLAFYAYRSAARRHHGQFARTE